jgi:two-component system cell cycle response regulator CtrA
MHILLVEDDTATARSIDLMVTGNGSRCAAAAGGEEGLRLAASLSYDLIVLDLMLPDMDGLDFIRRLRAAGTSTPVLVLSGITDIEHKIEALKRGADDYLTKPFDMRELAARMDSILRRAESDPDKTLRVGPLNIDFGRHTADIDGQALALSPKEFAILEILCLRRGEALHKEAILGHLYGGMDVPAAKIVDVFVCKLRKKLQAASAGGIQIDTVWGFGYVLRFTSADMSATRPRAA